MTLNPTAASAVATAGQQLIQKGASKAVQALPKGKQNTVRGIIMVAGALVMAYSGIRMLMRKKNMPVEG